MYPRTVTKGCLGDSQGLCSVYNPILSLLSLCPIACCSEYYVIQYTQNQKVEEMSGMGSISNMGLQSYQTLLGCSHKFVPPLLLVYLAGKTSLSIQGFVTAFGVYISLLVA